MQHALAHLLLFLACFLFFLKLLLAFCRRIRLPDFLSYLSVGVLTGLVMEIGSGLGQGRWFASTPSFAVNLLLTVCSAVFFFWLAANFRVAFSRGLPAGTGRKALLVGLVTFLVLSAGGLLVFIGPELLMAPVLGTIFMTLNVGPLIAAKIKQPGRQQTRIVESYAVSLLLDMAALGGFALAHTAYLVSEILLFGGLKTVHWVALAGSVAVYSLLTLLWPRIGSRLPGLYGLILLLLAGGLMLTLPVSLTAVAVLLGLLWPAVQKRLPLWLQAPHWKRIPELIAALAFAGVGFWLVEYWAVNRRLWLYLGYLILTLLIVTLILATIQHGKQKEAVPILALLFSRGEVSLLLLAQAVLAHLITPTLFVAAVLVVVFSTLLNQLLYANPQKSILDKRMRQR
ncbi:MAG: hypothetical protein D6715_06365 [Calditrichaeota bacterium]|nr:MAG: hypothetical protein D6715_06365 [Calditrichota bacterium]